jgi:hypothetical protein
MSKEAFATLWGRIGGRGGSLVPHWRQRTGLHGQYEDARAILTVWGWTWWDRKKGPPKPERLHHKESVLTVWGWTNGKKGIGGDARKQSFTHAMTIWGPLPLSRGTMWNWELLLREPAFRQRRRKEHDESFDDVQKAWEEDR